MRKIVHLGLVAAILATMLVAVLPVFEPRPVMAMSGNGTAENPFMITDVDDLQAMANNLAAHYKLANNIDASATRTWSGQTPGATWTTMTQISAHYLHTAGRRANNATVAAGWNEYGQCDIDEWSDITQVAVGVYHTVGLKADGSVVAEGRNNWGQLDVGSWNVTQVAAGGGHTLGIRHDGTVVAVGRDMWGQCGNIISDSYNRWWHGDIIQVVAGREFSAGLRAGGTVAIAGYGFGYIPKDARDAVYAWTDIVQLAAGCHHLVGLKSDGTVVAERMRATEDHEYLFGGYVTLYGQLDVDDWSGMTQIGAGTHNTVGLHLDGSVKAIGADHYKQVSSAVLWTEITQIDAGNQYIVGLKADGTVAAAGYGESNAAWVSGWYSGFAPVSTFTGSLDGDGYTITGLYINRPTTTNVGLFGRANGITVTDLHLADCTIVGEYNVGGIIGRDDGSSSISGCTVTGVVEAVKWRVGGICGELGVGSSITASATSTLIIAHTGSRAGGLVGRSYGDSISYSYATGDVWGGSDVGGLVGLFSSVGTIYRSYATGNVWGYNDVGGLVGENYGTISKSYATGTVVGAASEIGGLVGDNGGGTIIECFALGDVFVQGGAYYEAGGLAGRNSGGTISKSYARGTVYAEAEADTGSVGGLVGMNVKYASYDATIMGCYSTGLVHGSTLDIGGLVGTNSDSITVSFWDTATSGQSTSDGGMGRTTSYMTSIDLYKAAGWDIEERWIHPSLRNNGYPILSWQVGNSPTWIIHSTFPDDNQVVHFQPTTIILGTTLPNRAGGGGVYPNGTFSWGDNPAGIEIRLDGFLTPEDVYRFEPIMPGGWDIIEPEPGGMTGDVDLGKLAKNPFRPMVQVIASGAGFTERLAWLLLAIFILIAIMIAVLLWTQHMVFTALAGFAVGFMFYSMGVWGLWVVILLAFGLVASIVYERMPTL